MSEAETIRRLAQQFRQEEQNLKVDMDLAMEVYRAKINVLSSVWARLENEADRLEQEETT